jgi:hypothetical protein
MHLMYHTFLAISAGWSISKFYSCVWMQHIEIVPPMYKQHRLEDRFLELKKGVERSCYFA